ncbi:hypothetical protein PoB_001300300 [Plakobranchus ocellatus]|uniref:Uncharacterized protein n=1 Tax=Plakobranchus ocellatus TaxID=259542 RepID=A0AAV3YW88_9GAST|nr:hypothetical protein PoB_001300300 [Plakobranchus ocellatus]
MTALTPSRRHVMRPPMIFAPILHVTTMTQHLQALDDIKEPNLDSHAVMETAPPVLSAGVIITWYRESPKDRLFERGAKSIVEQESKGN